MAQTKNDFNLKNKNIEENKYKTDYIETKLDEADFQAENSDVRLTHEEVFDSIRKAIQEK